MPFKSMFEHPLSFQGVYSSILCVNFAIVFKLWQIQTDMRNNNASFLSQKLVVANLDDVWGGRV